MDQLMKQKSMNFPALILKVRKLYFLCLDDPDWIVDMDLNAINQQQPNRQHTCHKQTYLRIFFQNLVPMSYLLWLIEKHISLKRKNCFLVWSTCWAMRRSHSMVSFYDVIVNLRQARIQGGGWFSTPSFSCHFRPPPYLNPGYAAYFASISMPLCTIIYIQR